MMTGVEIVDAVPRTSVVVAFSCSIGLDCRFTLALRDIPSTLTEHRVLCTDGSYKWILDWGRVIKCDSEGHPLRVTGTHTDMTQQHRLFANLQEQESRFRTLFELYPDATVLIDTETGLPVQFNWVAHEQLGYTAARTARLWMCG
jgi:PAS domain-containing protein